MKYAFSLFIVLFVLSPCILLADDGRIEFVVCPSSNDQEYPDIYGDIVVWQEYISADGDYNIFAADINDLSQPPFFSVNAPNYQVNPAIFENYIVWQTLIQGDEAADWDIHMADISNPNEPSIYPVTGIVNNDEQYPAIHGNIVVWEDGTPDYLNIYGADITNPAKSIEFLVSGVDYDQRNPSIYRNTVVWEDSFAGNWDIYAADIWMRNKPTELPVSLVDYDQARPVISGDTIVWMDNFYGDWDIYAADISDIEHPVETAIAINVWNEVNPDIDGNIIVWQGWKNNNWDIFAHNMTTRQTYQITNDIHDQTNPAISGRTIVWQDNRNGNSEIYGTILSDIEAAYCTHNLAADLNHDCKVDEDDYLIMSSMWLDCNLYPPEACQ